MIITIDGPSGTGKSTVARGVAAKLGFSFFDTGAMYRSFAWKVLQEGIDPLDFEGVRALMPHFQFEVKGGKNGEKRYLVEGVDVTEAIRQPHISPAASQIAVYPEVRAALVPIQRSFGHQCDAVFEGRDMGTVVFPDADLKIFLTARPEVRARRRHKELLAKFPDLAQSLSFDQLLKEMKERDETDSNRSVSPLRQAEGAILIDTSDLTAEQVINKIIKLKPPKSKKFASMKLSYKLVYTLARWFFQLFFRLKVYGLKHFKQGSGVLVANHTSYYDPPVLSISCPEEVHFLAKEALFHVPFLGFLIKVLNTHPLSRGATDAHTFRLMIQLLQKGKKMILFPEGNRTFDGQLQPLERGLAFLILKAKVPIYPAYIEGAFNAWPRTRKVPKLFGKIRVAFGSPIHFEEFEGLEKREAEKKILQRTEASIRALKAWLEKGAKGIPP